MYKQLLAMLVVGIALGFQFGCGGSSGGSKPVPPGSTTGTVALYGGDVPACGITSFDMTFTGITLTPSTGGTPVSILSSGQSLTADFASLMDSNAPLALASVATGTYSQLNLTLSGAQLTYWNSTTSTPTTLSLTLPSLSVSLNLSPTVTVSSTSATALALDFDMLNSIVLQNGQITSNVQPQFTLTQATVGDNGFASIEDLRGEVSSITTSSTQSAYTGSLVLTPATGPNLTVYVSSSTTYAGVTGLSGLTAGTYVQIAGAIDSKGNLLASEIQAEEVENAADGQAAFRGVVSSVTRTSGSATQFGLLVQEEVPDLHTVVPLQSVVTFTIAPSSTTFAIASQAQPRSADFPNYNFAFGAQQLGVGQIVVVHGQVPTSGTPPVTGQARAIYFGAQPILGTLQTGATTPLVVNSANSKIGGFGLAPCSGIYPTIFTAITGADTTFTGLTDLNSLRTAGTPVLLLKGVFLYQQSPGTVNSVTWVPPTSLQFVNAVRQLP